MLPSESAGIWAPARGYQGEYPRAKRQQERRAAFRLIRMEVKLRHLEKFLVKLREFSLQHIDRGGRQLRRLPPQEISIAFKRRPQEFSVHLPFIGPAYRAIAPPHNLPPDSQPASSLGKFFYQGQFDQTVE